eukprot:CAMPEP_0177630068 /NCGR_PEP_ID=MMETSP0447-20121125/1011_1 /TAXON_ID=0 /ORGANISM="Stygamoeba regulata, Strain BSH-02190019" /LENGTH=464 /DNA_ID=CAMNT_0019131445 /DNA_START=398 /DNA_END=1792 /DNA_ORIENTATION=-
MRRPTPAVSSMVSSLYSSATQKAPKKDRSIQKDWNASSSSGEDDPDFLKGKVDYRLYEWKEDNGRMFRDFDKSSTQGGGTGPIKFSRVIADNAAGFAHYQDSDKSKNQCVVACLTEDVTLKGVTYPAGTKLACIHGFNKEVSYYGEPTRFTYQTYARTGEPFRRYGLMKRVMGTQCINDAKLQQARAVYAYVLPDNNGMHLRRVQQNRAAGVLISHLYQVGWYVDPAQIEDSVLRPIYPSPQASWEELERPLSCMNVGELVDKAAQKEMLASAFSRHNFFPSDYERLVDSDLHGGMYYARCEKYRVEVGVSIYKTGDWINARVVGNPEAEKFPEAFANRDALPKRGGVYHSFFSRDLDNKEDITLDEDRGDGIRETYYHLLRYANRAAYERQQRDFMYAVLPHANPLLASGGEDPKSIFPHVDVSLDWNVLSAPLNPKDPLMNTIKWDDVESARFFFDPRDTLA